MTKLTCHIRCMSSIGSPPTATMSANLPGVTLPRSASLFISRAAWMVADWTAYTRLHQQREVPPVFAMREYTLVGAVRNRNTVLIVCTDCLHDLGPDQQGLARDRRGVRSRSFRLLRDEGRGVHGRHKIGPVIAARSRRMEGRGGCYATKISQGTPNLRLLVQYRLASESGIESPFCYLAGPLYVTRQMEFDPSSAT